MKNRQRNCPAVYGSMLLIAAGLCANSVSPASAQDNSDASKKLPLPAPVQGVIALASGAAHDASSAALSFQDLEHCTAFGKVVVSGNYINSVYCLDDPTRTIVIISKSSMTRQLITTLKY